MNEEVPIESRVFAGPNALVPYAAVVLEYQNPFPAPLPAERITELLTPALPAATLHALTPEPGEIAFEQLAARLARALHELAGPCGLPVEVQHAEADTCRMLLGFHDPQAAMEAAHTALRIASAVFARAAGGPDRTQAIATALQRCEGVMRMRQPDAIACALMRAARARAVPVYSVSPGSRIWRYGQGSAGLNFFEAGSERDSLTGTRLTQDKFLMNQLVRRLGLPGVRHGIAADAGRAADIAAELGYPVVVKPISRGKGLGVSAGVANEDELAAAVAIARPHSPQGVIVEQQVPGDDHRLVVIGGAFKWAVQRIPPRVTGDGEHTVAELIARENRNRSDADVAAGFVTRLKVDPDMLSVLAKQGLLLEDRPSPGRSVRLRSIANTATGGTIADRSESIHADNREMAETIARALPMDAIGIDFMTTDISKSWRELNCAVIEVNATPGFSSDGRAEIILGDKFAAGDDGRIPVVVLIGADPALVERAAEALGAAGRRVGRTNAELTLLAGRARCAAGATLPERVLALLLDPACDALVIATSVAEIEAQGFPLDRCDLAMIAASCPVPDALRRVIETCAAETLADAEVRSFERDARPSFERLLAARPRTPRS